MNSSIHGVFRYPGNRIAHVQGCIRTLGLWVLLLAAGCTTHAPTATAPRSYTVYPAPPATPRIQYLTTISKPEDVEPPQSALLTFLVGPPPPKPALGIAYGMAFKHGQLYLSDRLAGTIHVVDFAKRKWEFVHPTGRGALKKNIGIDVADDETMYVTDTMRGLVLVYGPDHHYLGSLGEEKELKPTDVKVRGDRVYVADLGGKVRVYDRATLKQVASIPEGTPDEARKLFQPIGLDFDAAGNLYVSDAGAFRIQVYDREGHYVRTVGRHGTSPGEFARNKGVALDRAGRVYAVDNAFQNVQIFDETGHILMYFGESEAGVDGHLDLPSAVIVDYDHVDFFRRFVEPGRDIEHLIFVSNSGPSQKVAVYGFLKQPDAAPAKP